VGVADLDIVLPSVRKNRASCRKKKVSSTLNSEKRPSGWGGWQPKKTPAGGRLLHPGGGDGTKEEKRKHIPVVSLPISFCEEDTGANEKSTRVVPQINMEKKKNHRDICLTGTLWHGRGKRGAT